MAVPHPLRGDRGQATVELVALLPLIVVLAALLWQAVVAGQAIWLSGSAARAAARAHAIGADAPEAARRVLPARLRRSLVVRPAASGGGVQVAIAVPAIVGGGRLTTVTAQARLQEQR